MREHMIMPLQYVQSRTVDFMTAEAAEIPFEVLQTVMSRIINEVKGVNRVFYDLHQ